MRWAVAFAGLWAPLAIGQVLGYEKLESESILNAAKAGQSQEVMVNFETAGIEYKFDSQRLDLSKRLDAELRAAWQNQAASKLIEAKLRREDDNLLQGMQLALSAIKQAVLADHLSGACVMVHDFSSLPDAIIRVPDYDSLLKLLSNQGVRRVRTFKTYVLD